MVTYEELNAIIDGASPLARAANNARNALKRSKSKKNIAAFEAAEDAFSQYLTIVDAAYAAYEDSENMALIEVAAQTKIVEDYAQPSLFV